MDQLDSRVYYGLKDKLRQAQKDMSKGDLRWWDTPIILIDFHQWDVFYFKNKYEAKEFLEKHYSSWDDEPPEGTDENLVLLKYCTESEKETFGYSSANYEFYKEINGQKIYREKSYVEFEPELIINVIL